MPPRCSQDTSPCTYPQSIPLSHCIYGLIPSMCEHTRLFPWTHECETHCCDHEQITESPTLPVVTSLTLPSPEGVSAHVRGSLAQFCTESYVVRRDTKAQRLDRNLSLSWSGSLV